MNRHIHRADRTRRLASLALGSLAVLALAASPAMAHAKIGTVDTVRHTLLASELNGADATEVADLESMLDIEDGDSLGDNVNQVDQVDQQGSQGDQAETSNDSQPEVDTEDSQDDSSDTSGDSSDTETHVGDHSGSNGGNDGGGD